MVLKGKAMRPKEQDDVIKTMRRWRHERPEYWVFADDMYNWANTREKRELVLLFSIMAAGKSADRTSDALNYMMHMLPGNTPLDKIRGLVKRQDALEKLKSFRIGQHNRILKAFRAIVDFDVDVTPPDPDKLRNIPGIGLKTSSFVALVYDRTLPVAVLDTHVLKFLRNRMKIEAPLGTPSSAKIYDRLSRPIIRLATLLDVTCGDLNIVLWKLGKEGKTNFPNNLMAMELGLDEDKVEFAIQKASEEYRVENP
jgi:thermostable 8-oxoguanine DNA glycosylase